MGVEAIRPQPPAPTPPPGLLEGRRWPDDLNRVHSGLARKLLGLDRHGAGMRMTGDHRDPDLREETLGTRAFADLSDRTRSHRLTANLTANLHAQRRTGADDHGQMVDAHKYATDADGPPRTVQARLRKPLLYPLSYEATYCKRPQTTTWGQI